MKREANALGHRLLQAHVAREKQYDQRTPTAPRKARGWTEYAG